MKTNTRLFTSVVLTAIFVGCSIQKPDVIISLELKSLNKVTRVSFQKDYEAHKLLDKSDLEQYKTGEFISLSTNIEYSYEGSGEHTCTICIFTISDTLCTELYTEKGYRPQLLYDGDSLIVTRSF
ncbi:MAG: hypothetical protein ACYC1Q_01590 [Bacteroidia bacterium]